MHFPRQGWTLFWEVAAIVIYIDWCLPSEAPEALPNDINVAKHHKTHPALVVKVLETNLLWTMWNWIYPQIQVNVCKYWQQQNSTNNLLILLGKRKNEWILCPSSIWTIPKNTEFHKAYRFYRHSLTSWHLPSGQLRCQIRWYSSMNQKLGEGIKGRHSNML